MKFNRVHFQGEVSLHQLSDSGEMTLALHDTAVVLDRLALRQLLQSLSAVAVNKKV